MALIVKDRVKETTTTTGTGTITLGGAAPGFQSFSVIGNGNTTYYTIQGGTEWEVGIGTYTSSGTTLSRDTILESSNGGTAVNFSAGSKDVFVTYPAERSMYVDGSTIVPAVTATLPAASGGTGQSSYAVGDLLYASGSTALSKLAGVATGNVLLSGGVATAPAWGKVGLTTHISGTLAIGNGGTGLTAAATNGQLLIGNGTGYTLATVTAGTGISITNGAGSISIAATNNGTVTSVSGTGTVNGISLSGTVTSSGSLTLGGTLSGVSLTTQVTGTLPVANGGTGAATLTGVVIGNGTSAFTTKTNPTGDFVGTTDTQTLTNKTLTDPAIIGTILEDVFTITDGAAFEVDPSNGSIQLITLGANRTPKATNFAAGESVTLMVDDGTARTITWTDATFGSGGVIWETNKGTAPTLATSGYTTIVLWKVGSQVYGARVGDA
jgi:hypothetical protein